MGGVEMRRQQQEQEGNGEQGSGRGAGVGPASQGSSVDAAAGANVGDRVTVGKGKGAVELVLLKPTVTAWQDQDSLSAWQARGAMVPSAPSGLRGTVTLAGS
jgi:hypothetical protein